MRKPNITAGRYNDSIKAGRYKLVVPHPLTGVRSNEDYRDLWASKLWSNAKLSSRSVSKMITSSSNWDNDMRKTYRIELKIDFDSEERHEALLMVAKQYARDFLGSAMLLQDRSKPACVLHTDDTFIGMEEIDILAESENLHAPEGISNE